MKKGLAVCAVLVGLAVVLWGPAPPASNANPDLRDKLVLANRILARENLVGPFGHVSVRQPGSDHFWIADHRSPDTVEREHLVEVQLDIASSDGLYREIFIHSSIYAADPAVAAVVHTHAPHAVALGTLTSEQNRILPTTNPGANLGTFIPIYPTTGLIDTPDKGNGIFQTLQGQNGLLIRGHGTVVVGPTLEQAVLRAIYLELEARSQLWSRSAGEPVFFSPEEAQPFVQTRAVRHAWDYFAKRATTGSTNR